MGASVSILSWARTCPPCPHRCALWVCRLLCGRRGVCPKMKPTVGEQAGAHRPWAGRGQDGAARVGLAFPTLAGEGWLPGGVGSAQLLGGSQAEQSSGVPSGLGWGGRSAGPPLSGHMGKGGMPGGRKACPACLRSSSAQWRLSLGLLVVWRVSLKKETGTPTLGRALSSHPKRRKVRTGPLGFECAPWPVQLSDCEKEAVQAPAPCPPPPAPQVWDLGRGDLEVRSLHWLQPPNSCSQELSCPGAGGLEKEGGLLQAQPGPQPCREMKAGLSL